MRKNNNRRMGWLVAIVGIGAFFSFAPYSEALPPVVVQVPSLQMELEKVDFPPVPASTEVKEKAKEEE
ncbi:hypothetical protein C1X05_01095 [Laceyella sacchari]|jgi:hypothetical protein|uniref:Uncharacterized protein n=2 Tax=Laceyella TaxID=292635 RepID=A0AA45WRB5_9BACL|nr:MULTISPECIES: hypothetical protein [Laceyella]AUS07590.1 hypothetical protein C1X05_01095 [Laceyella sacchari]TCW36637.1 hypothetical protein EDC32_10487 [Laceyella sacchari]UWE03819.1 hypothetical protein NYR52_00985 [Laceyella sacchari]SMP30655.1 hypothetical protein SAMN06265361_10789 [Laceyella tengchongensis]